MLCQRGEEYNHFMVSKLAEAFSPKPAPAAQENAFRMGAFNTAVRELTSYYINIVSSYEILPFLLQDVVFTCEINCSDLTDCGRHQIIMGKSKSHTIQEAVEICPSPMI